MVKIRQADIEDMKRISDIYDRARSFMRSSSNPNQWPETYPNEEIIKKDIHDGICFVCPEGRTVVAVFSFIIGPEPTYDRIRDGAWRYNEPYGTIHRLAVAATARGAAQACFSFCAGRHPYLRVDTHRDNLPTRRAVEKFGFIPCGIVAVRGGERIAYDYKAE